MILELMATVWNFFTTFTSTEVDKTKLNQLRNTVRHSLKRSVLSEASFLPENQIKKLVTPDKIKAILPNAKPELVDFICKHAKKLFLTASFHHGNLQDIMDTFKYHGMTDKELPIRDLTSEDMYCDVHTEGLQRVCSHEKALEAFHRWDTHDVWTFYNDQWTFCAPILDMECSSHEFHAKHILPFIEKGTTQKDGHFSTVFQAVIHPSHQISHGSSKSNTDQTRVALKELKNLSEQKYNVHVSWLNEANALFQIAGLRHKHLISQATAFKQGERRFIMLEWANGGTLRDIWQTESHDRSFLDGNKVMRVLEELTGLASALSKLHGTNTRTKTAKATSADRTKKGPASRSKTIFSQGQGDGDGNRLTVPKIRFEGVGSDDGDDSSNNAEEQHWRHGDLKPENILHFKDEKSPWLGTLKITDLGLAKQHAFAATQRQDPTRQRYTTSHYEAPEVITTMNSRVPRSCRYDIWSMGCIIFEYMIWLLYGYEEGLRSLYNEKKDINAHQETLYFTADLSTRQAQVSDVARSWISHILDVDPECNRATPSVIRDLVVLVRDKLLVVDLPNEHMSREDIKRCRASADDLDIILNRIRRAAIQDEYKGGNYLSSGKGRNGVLPPRPRQARKLSFFSTCPVLTSEQGTETTMSSVPATEISNSLGSNHEASTNPSSLSYEGLEDQVEVTRDDATLSFLSFKSPETEDKLKINDDIQSVISFSEEIGSLAEPAPGIQEARYAAVTYIIDIFTRDPELLTLYETANQNMDENRFIRNHQRLLKEYVVGLLAQEQTSSQRLATEFLRCRPHRTRISQGIYNSVKPSDRSVRERLDTAFEQDKKLRIMLDRYLSQQGPSEDDPMPDDQDSTDLPSDDSDDDYQYEEGVVLSNLEEAREFLVTGRPFRTYKDHLHQFLNPCLTTELNDIESERVIRSSWWLWIMSVWFAPPPGYQRIAYLCGCGNTSYLDVKELSPGGVDRFRRRIVDYASTARGQTQDSIIPCDQPNPPAQAHLSSSTAMSPSQSTTTGPTGIQAMRTLSQGPNINPPGDPQYLIVCINAKRSTVHRHIETLFAFN
ncbi:hypothetical protein BFJ66_g16171 [Fusarium oxysporum f. sp. cepae]|uniref:Protein kinase domain-containing protein n=1 Tax=Fusarium oxysporum f. sp. cepae TaxID=396571 RepID=A0A3L6MSX8_FUSOX|nr:hypothetical protein BFJ65_g18127 [Fusarium oxysporum f. sp. cepae]RKK30733.1 hypothetical protein BFJ66_g16171 [Fusarium oxysporum f. sp. cepae]RKK36102.1 hypothetical protein BFJ67_g12952 [Fusarium oxysporum f. sp. cepae]